MTSKETLLNSYIDVKGWSEEDVKKAAEWLAENTGMKVAYKYLAMLDDSGYHYLIADEHDNTVWVGGRVEMKHRTQLTDLSFMRTNEEEPMNTLESLKKATQELSFAKDCLKASQEAVEDAQEAYTEAYRSFKKEADRLLRQEDETPDIPSDEGSSEGSEDDSPEWFIAMYSPIDDRFDDLPVLTVSATFTAKKYCHDYFSVYFQGKERFFSRDSFCKRFERVVE